MASSRISEKRFLSLHHRSTKEVDEMGKAFRSETEGTYKKKEWKFFKEPKQKINKLRENKTAYFKIKKTPFYVGFGWRYMIITFA